VQLAGRDWPRQNLEPESVSQRIHPVILSGGSGTRLWPLSRRAHPKQLMPLVGEHTLLQQTTLRVADPARFAPPLVVCNEAHRFIIAEQLRACGIEPRAIVLEPVARNTAPAIAAAASMVHESDPDGLLLVLPSDHVVRDADAFGQAIAQAARAAGRGALTTFGIVPDHPETGYGYIRRGEALEGVSGAYRVAEFVEKPPREQAEAFVAKQEYSWNSGMFLLPVEAFLAELESLQPRVVESVQAALASAERDLNFTRLDESAFGASPSISIDHALMEHTRHAAVVPVEMGWSDVGAWKALWEIGERDAAGNVTVGDVRLHDVSESYVRSEKRLVTAAGVRGLVIVETDDAILVAPRERAQEVKAIVDLLDREGRSEAEVHARVYRPWGYYEGIAMGERYQVKQITVHPGHKLSLQMHHHRAEHWIVVRGTARVTKGDEQLLLSENQSTYIPIGVQHRLENPGEIDLTLIEVQSGSYLGEDDIVRFDDLYGRG
jgi:mannose-1-phosphate guanylyltransferase/mannose-6-phosphate isomerase